MKIVKEHVIYKGNKYYIQSTGRYYQNGNSHIKPRLLHRKVWFDHYGEIPEGYVIHHKDHNWRNNNIDNLELIEKKLHLKNHAKELYNNDDYVRKNKIALNKAQIAAKQWHASKVGHEWHIKHGKSCWENKKKSPINCCVCNKIYLTPFPSRTRFCSQSCQQKISYQYHKTDIRFCKICNKEFKANKYRKTLTCSRSCGSKLR
jgi:hypothetical protein